MPVYTIMVFEKIECKHGFCNLGCKRLVGFYHNFDEAEQAVTTNAGDINETCYNYAIIERVKPGLYQCATSEDRTLYKFNYETHIYNKIEEPEFFNRFVGFTIG